MKLRTYQAYTMAEALDAVKGDLGVDAVILNTRTYRRGGFLGLGRRTIIEVTASAADDHAQASARQAAEPQPAPRARTARGSMVTRLAARRAYGTTDTTAGPSPDPIDSERRAQRILQALAEQHERRQQPPELTAPILVENVLQTREPHPVRQVVETMPAATAAVPAASTTEPKPGAVMPTPPVEDADGPPRRFLLTETNTAAATPPAPAAQPDARPAHRPVANSPAVLPVSNVMQDELTAIRNMVGQVLQCQAGAGRPAEPMPEPLFEHYLKLIAQDVSEELANRIVGEVRAELSSHELDDPITIGAAVRRHLATYIPVAGQAVPTTSPDDRPLIIALVGPTGVGKTTTLAKLAATFKLKHHKSVGMVTSDTYRIAAVDQLRTYANIIGLPLQVALTPADMRQAMHALSHLDVILIDTAGRSQHDTRRIRELKEFIDAANPHETHLVLSSTASEKVLMRESEAFSMVGVDKIVLTKLDEAVSFGMLVNVIRRIGKDLSFVTTGQEVPDHIEAGRSERLADLVLGAEVHA